MCACMPGGCTGAAGFRQQAQTESQSEIQAVSMHTVCRQLVEGLLVTVLGLYRGYLSTAGCCSGIVLDICYREETVRPEAPS